VSGPLCRVDRDGKESVGVLCRLCESPETPVPMSGSIYSFSKISGNLLLDKAVS